MTLLRHRFGGTAFAKVADSGDLKEALDDTWMESETVIVKPNWVCVEPGGFTDAKIMRTLFEALDSRIVVTESLHLGRSFNLHPDGMAFTADGEEVNWRWLLKGDGWKWLYDKPDWGWFKEGGHWEQIVREDEAFLDEQGFTDLFEEFGVEYVNTTDEVWRGRHADPAEVRGAVESRFTPVHYERMYGMVPQRLYDLRGSTFISLARLKQYATFTLKNMFGMIVDPMRSWWHGPGNDRIASSIVDINKVYHSLFNVYGVLTSLYGTAVPNPEGEHLGVTMGRYDVVEGFGFVACGRDLVSIDSLLMGLTEGRIGVAERVNREPIRLAEEEKLGASDDRALEEARVKVGGWFTPCALAV
jgi:uncharacterized protein (DUF362 family)